MENDVDIRSLEQLIAALIDGASGQLEVERDALDKDYTGLAIGVRAYPDHLLLTLESIEEMEKENDDTDTV